MRGARVVGIDNSPAQLASARQFQEEFGLEFPVLHAIAEDLPFPDESFDLAISEYGALDLGRPLPVDPRSGPGVATRR